jgi:beta-1,3-galactosyltransferase 1
MIRETWLTPSYNNTGQVRHVFLIGTTNDEILTSQVKQEHVDFGDIIQFSFYESYRNLTLKTLMGFKWATEFCSSAHVITKTDDDAYVNINGLLRTLLPHGSSLKMSVAGLCEIRDTNPSSKWYVSPKEYSYRCYHGICHGFGYTTSIHTLHNILKEYVNILYIYLEDVYIYDSA